MARPERDGVAGAAPEEQRQQQDEGERAQDVDISEAGVRGEVGVESGKLRRRVGIGWSSERDDAAKDDGNRDHDAEPEADFQSERKSAGEVDACGCSLPRDPGRLGRIAAHGPSLSSISFLHFILHIVKLNLDF